MANLNYLINKQKDKEKNLWSSVVSAAWRFGWLTTLVEDGESERWTYLKLLLRAVGYRALWANVVKTEKVGVLMPNRPATLALLLGVWSSERCAALLNITSGAAGIASACEVAGVRSVISSRGFLNAIGASTLPETMPHLNWIWVEDHPTHWYDQWFNVLSLMRLNFSLTSNDGDSEAVVLFTSGSEGKPKGVSLSHRNLLSNIEQICSALDFSASDKFFIALPMFHSFGLTVGCLLPLIRGIPLCLFVSPLQTKRIAELIGERHCTVLFGSSSFLSQWGRAASPADFAHLRYVIAGAEKLQPIVRDYWIDKFGIVIFEGYGVTETSPVIAVNTRYANRIGTVGKLVPNMRAALAPVEGLTEGGRLHVAGPNVMRGYYLPEYPAQLSPVSSMLGEPWYDTGDLAVLEADGFVRILGRQKRFAKIGGEMVSLALTETIAREVSPEMQHAAVAISDANKGEKIVLVTTDTNIQRSFLVDVLKVLALPELCLPKHILVVDALPLLGSGKLDLVALSQLASGVYDR
jgi:acyl-[acyl-carrier-protein]-phospholipid O-acyltransferase/long-chain-fatty-acid--[acyl-carrier-protein] ligase